MPPLFHRYFRAEGRRLFLARQEDVGCLQPPLRRKATKALMRERAEGVTPVQRQTGQIEKLVVSAGKLFCTACEEEVDLKKCIIELHYYRDEGKGILLTKRSMSMVQ